MSQYYSSSRHACFCNNIGQSFYAPEIEAKLLRLRAQRSGLQDRFSQLTYKVWRYQNYSNKLEARYLVGLTSKEREAEISKITVQIQQVRKILQDENLELKLDNIEQELNLLLQHKKFSVPEYVAALES